MYLNQESSGRKFSLEIVYLVMPDTDRLHPTGNIKSGHSVNVASCENCVTVLQALS